MELLLVHCEWTSQRGTLLKHSLQLKTLHCDSQLLEGSVTVRLRFHTMTFTRRVSQVKLNPRLEFATAHC